VPLGEELKPGTLFLVVGPSGSGKDTLIGGAQAALAGDPRFVFPRRVITRPREAGGEEHEPATRESFACREVSGAFALAWEAHGLSYGIPRSIEAELASGRAVIVNVSRAVIERARQRYRPIRIVAVTAPIEVLARRLATRGRETAADIAARLTRAGAVPVEGPDVVEIDNSGIVTEGVREFLAALGVESQA
jgi:ribose 1,5-bisphosphokinase